MTPPSPQQSPLYKTEHPAHEPIVPIFYTDTLAGINFQPTDYVDITDYPETKKKMFLCHESQIQWLGEHHSTEPTYFLETVARFRGLQCGVQCAEAFRKLNVWGRITTEEPLP